LFFYGCGWLFCQIAYPVSYRSVLNKYATANQLDPLLVSALIFSESRFKEKAISSAGAIGLMQLMPLTAVEVSKELKMVEFIQEDLFNPTSNIQIGCYYLSKLKRRLQSNETWWVLAAYNAGEANVRKWKKDALPNQSKMEVIQFKETRHYVKKVELIHVALKICEKMGII